MTVEQGYKRNTNIVDSTGGPGRQVRSHRRVVDTIVDGSFIPHAFIDTIREHRDQISPDGRIMARGVVNREGINNILRIALDPTIRDFGLSDIETIAPFPDGERHWVVTGRNFGARQPVQDVFTIAQEVEAYQAEVKNPLEHMDRLHAQGYYCISSVPDELKDQLFDLWHDTFGWDKKPSTKIGLDTVTEEEKRHEQIDAFAEILNIQNNLENPEEREFWFSGIVKKDDTRNMKLVAATLGQRFDNDFGNGSIIVECSEYAAAEEEKGNGLIPAATAVLKAQILKDVGVYNRENVLIYAECNVASGAYKSAKKAGLDHTVGRFTVFGDDGETMEVVIPNVHPQNVAVGDGFSNVGYVLTSPDGENEELRDFSFHSLSVDAMQELYSDEIVQEVSRNLAEDDDKIREALRMEEGYEHSLYTTA